MTQQSGISTLVQVENGGTSRSRRGYLKYVGVSAAAALAGCSSLGGGDSFELVAAGAGGSWGEFERNIFFDPWEEESGNEVTKQNMRGIDIAQQIQANKGDHNIHVGGMANIRASELGSRDLVLPVRDHLDNLDQLIEGAVNEYFAAYIFTPWGLGYNSDKVDKNITNWEDMLDSSFKGNVAFPAWGWMGSLWVYGLNAALGGSVEDISPALDFVGKLVQDQDAIVMESADHGLRLFQNEEIVIAPYFNARTDQIELETDINTDFTIPEGGSIGRTYGYAMVAGHSDSATAEMASLNEYMLKPKVQARFAEETGYPPTNKNAEQHIDESVLEERPTIKLSKSERESLARNPVDWAKVPEYRDGHAEDWRRIVQG
jgi:spermidine/putrescine-binding protein